VAGSSYDPNGSWWALDSARVDTGHWGSIARPAKLEAVAESLGLGEAAFIRYQPAPLSGNNGPFSPDIDRTWGEVRRPGLTRGRDWARPTWAWSMRLPRPWLDPRRPDDVRFKEIGADRTRARSVAVSGISAGIGRRRPSRTRRRATTCPCG
jgi:hypothetical protein